MGRIRIPLKEETSREDLHGFFFEADWDVVALLDRDEEADLPLRIVWSNFAKDTRVTYIDGHALGVRYLLVEGEEGERIERALRSALRTYDVRRLLDEIDGETNRARRLHLSALLAVASPERVDARFLRVFETLLGSDDAAVRHAVLFHLAYVGWEELRPMVERLASRDDDERVRERARLLLEGLDSLGGQGAGASR